MKKIGIGVLTCNRQDFFEKCINSIPDVGDIIVVNDGNPYRNYEYPSKVKNVIQHTTNKGIGISKNDALRELYQRGSEYIFLIEDDMIIKKDNVFEDYIKAAAKSGLWRLSFGFHGPANKKDKQPNPREIIDYGDGIEIAFNLHSVGSFCLFHKGIIKNVGYMDERFQNCWEHIDFDMRVIKIGLLPAYWWWPDLNKSWEYIDEIACSEINSVIRKTPEWHKNLQIGAGWFKHKHLYFPTQVPDLPKEQLLTKLDIIQKNYSKDFNLL